MSQISRRSFLTNSSALLAGSGLLVPTMGAQAAVSPQASAVQNAGLQLLQLFRAPPDNAADKLKAIISAMDVATEPGSAWAVHQGGSMVVASRPVHGTASTRTGRAAALSVRNGAQLAALIEEQAERTADKSELGSLVIAPESGIKVVQGEGAGRWNIAVALAPGAKASGRVVTAIKPVASGWQQVS
jgi:hypothetical protein